MFALIQFNIILLAVAMSIGVVTGWWMFGRRWSDAHKPEDESKS